MTVRYLLTRMETLRLALASYAACPKLMAWTLAILRSRSGLSLMAGP